MALKDRFKTAHDTGIGQDPAWAVETPMMTFGQLLKSYLNVADTVTYASRPKGGADTYDTARTQKEAQKFEQSFGIAEEKIETPKMSAWETLKSYVGIGDRVAYADRPRGGADTYDDDRLARDLSGKKEAPRQSGLMRMIDGLDKVSGGLLTWVGNKTLGLFGADAQSRQRKEEQARAKAFAAANPLPEMLKQPVAPPRAVQRTVEAPPIDVTYRAVPETRPDMPRVPPTPTQAEVAAARARQRHDTLPSAGNEARRAVEKTQVMQAVQPPAAPSRTETIPRLPESGKLTDSFRQISADSRRRFSPAAPVTPAAGRVQPPARPN